MKKIMHAVKSHYDGLGHVNKIRFHRVFKKTLLNKDAEGFLLLLEEIHAGLTDEEKEFARRFVNEYLARQPDEVTSWAVHGFGVHSGTELLMNKLIGGYRLNKVLGVLGKTFRKKGVRVCPADNGMFGEIMDYYGGYLKERALDLENYYKDISDKYGDNEPETVRRLFALVPGYLTNNNEYGIQHGGVEDIFNDRVSSSLYMLKYGYAYLYLYYHMYMDLLSVPDCLVPDEGFRIMSIGCGPKTDYLGFMTACAVSGKTCGKETSYLGIEPALWDGVTLYENDGSTVENVTIEEFLDSHETVDSNVIMLSYSLPSLISGEYEKNGITPWQYMTKELPKKITCEKLIVMTPLRGKGLLTNVTDTLKYNEMEDSLINCGYIKVKRILRAERRGQIEDELGIKEKLGFSEDGHIHRLLSRIKNEHGNGETELPFGIANTNRFINYVIDIYQKKS